MRFTKIPNILSNVIVPLKSDLYDYSTKRMLFTLKHYALQKLWHWIVLSCLAGAQIVKPLYYFLLRKSCTSYVYITSSEHYHLIVCVKDTHFMYVEKAFSSYMRIIFTFYVRRKGRNSDDVLFFGTAPRSNELRRYGENQLSILQLFEKVTYSFFSISEQALHAMTLFDGLRNATIRDPSPVWLAADLMTSIVNDVLYISKRRSFREHAFNGTSKCEALAMDVEHIDDFLAETWSSFASGLEKRPYVASLGDIQTFCGRLSMSNHTNVNPVALECFGASSFDSIARVMDSTEQLCSLGVAGLLPYIREDCDLSDWYRTEGAILSLDRCHTESDCHWCHEVIRLIEDGTAVSSCLTKEYVDHFKSEVVPITDECGERPSNMKSSVPSYQRATYVSVVMMVLFTNLQWLLMG